MNKWTKVTNCNGLYLNSNGRYYIRRSSPDRSFHSLKTTNLREAAVYLKCLAILGAKDAIVNARQMEALSESKDALELPFSERG